MGVVFAFLCSEASRNNFFVQNVIGGMFKCWGGLGVLHPCRRQIT